MRLAKFGLVTIGILGAIGIVVSLTLNASQTVRGMGCVNLNADILSAEKNFAKGTARFIAIGDTGLGGSKPYKVAESMGRVCGESGCDFVLLLGDNFYNSGVSSLQDPQFESKFAKIFEPLHLPFYPVLGNHDFRGKVLYQVLYSLRHPLWRMPNYSYQFDTAPARFYGLNTNCNLLQLNRFKNQLEASPTPGNKWTVSFGHHTLYSTGRHGNADWLSLLYWKTFADKVDFYLSGHDHQLEHLVSSNGQTHYIVSGAGSQPRTSPPADKSSGSEPQSRFRYQDLGFVWFELTPSKATVRFHDGQGAALYEFEQLKNSKIPLAQ